MAIVDAINKVTGGHGATIEEAIKNFSGGSGGGGSDDFFVVHVTEDETQDVMHADKSYQEISNAVSSEKIVVAIMDNVMYTYSGLNDSAIVFQRLHIMEDVNDNSIICEKSEFRISSDDSVQLSGATYSIAVVPV